MLYFFRTRLNEAYIANVSFAKFARTFICCPQLHLFKKNIQLLCVFNLARDGLPYFGVKGRYAFCSKVRKLCCFFVFAELNHFSDCMVSVQSGKYLSLFHVLNYFWLCKFLSLRLVDFFGEYLLICPFSANYLKRDFFIFVYKS